MMQERRHFTSGFFKVIKRGEDGSLSFPLARSDGLERAKAKWFSSLSILLCVGSSLNA